jgi:hypothetical protein
VLNILFLFFIKTHNQLIIRHLYIKFILNKIKNYENKIPFHFSAFLELRRENTLF